MKVFIIEDEPLALRNTEALIRENFPEIEIVGSAGSVADSVAFLRRNPRAADLIFMDVELSDGTCFDIMERVETLPYAVMTTAYDSYAVKAFEVDSVDYLLKPLDPEGIGRAVRRAEERMGRPAPEPQTSAHKERYLIRINDRIVPVNSADVAYFYSESKNSYITTKGGSTYILDDSLDTISQSLDPGKFFRISRGAIVSKDAVESISKILGGRLKLTLLTGIAAETELTVSRARTDSFLKWMEK